MTSSFDTPDAEKAALIAARRQRYEDLKAAGDSITPRVLPAPTARGGAPLAADAVRHAETIPGGWYWTKVVRRGEGLRLLNTAGNPGVALFAWNLADPSERYNSADTVKVQWTADLRKGRVLFSDMGRAILSIVEDSCCAHDTIVGGSTPASNHAKYGDAALRNTRENMWLAAAKHGLGVRDVAPVISFFSPLSFVDHKPVWRDGVVQPGDFVDLRAEIDLIVAVSNCPHPLAPDTTFAPAPIEALVFRLPEATADDLCRTATAEARRGFDNTATYLQA
ncbi:urea amidolyase associated protein UAAP1 [Xanthobacter sp. V4C-4]|uniref:urea amidolyase associated protein UAAP1 n=1 Tax=Xanthobacter cornucopiae TaxID=3119924 RepID=UPI003729035B